MACAAIFASVGLPHSGGSDEGDDRRDTCSRLNPFERRSDFNVSHDLFGHLILNQVETLRLFRTQLKACLANQGQRKATFDPMNHELIESFMERGSRQRRHFGRGRSGGHHCGTIRLVHHPALLRAKLLNHFSEVPQFFGLRRSLHLHLHLSLRLSLGCHRSRSFTRRPSRRCCG